MKAPHMDLYIFYRHTISTHELYAQIIHCLWLKDGRIDALFFSLIQTFGSEKIVRSVKQKTLR